MNDRELLERAAKACGLAPEYVWHSDPFYEGFMRRNFDESGFEIETQFWNPLHDDGDALRLAVDLNLSINQWCNRTDIMAEKDVCIFQAHAMEPYAATRRAIVRAAAEIQIQRAIAS